jgi:hypothetical protein
MEKELTPELLRKLCTKATVLLKIECIEKISRVEDKIILKGCDKKGHTSFLPEIIINMHDIGDYKIGLSLTRKELGENYLNVTDVSIPEELQSEREKNLIGVMESHGYKYNSTILDFLRAIYNNLNLCEKDKAEILEVINSTLNEYISVQNQKNNTNIEDESFWENIYIHGLKYQVHQSTDHESN